MIRGDLAVSRLLPGKLTIVPGLGLVAFNIFNPFHNVSAMVAANPWVPPSHYAHGSTALEAASGPRPAIGARYPEDGGLRDAESPRQAQSFPPC